MKNDKKKPQTKGKAAKKAAPRKAAPKKGAKAAPAKKPAGGLKAAAAKAKSTVQKAAKAVKEAASKAVSAAKKNPFVPEGAAWVNVYLTVKDVRAAIDFYKKAFGFQEAYAMEGPGGMVMHGEVVHEGQRIMMGPASPQWQTKTPKELGGCPFGVYVYVRDVDAVFKRAVAAGAVSIREPQDQFYGDRTCMVEDPDGIRWSFGKFLEEVSPEEMDKRMAAMGGDHAKAHKDAEHEHAHAHDEHACHTHAHDHSHGGEHHAHEHTHGHAEHGHSHEGGHEHEHKHEHDHSHEGHDHSHEGHDHEHGHEGHSHS